MHTVWEEVSFVLMKGKEGENVYANMTSQDFQINFFINKMLN